MTLLRVSDFCRPPTNTPQRFEIYPLIATQGSCDAIDPCSTAQVSLDVLVSLSLQDGDLATMGCGSCRVVVRMQMIRQEQQEYSSKKGSLVLISPLTATNLGIIACQTYPTGTGTSSHELLRVPALCWMEACFEKPQAATKVTLRPLAYPSNTAWPYFFQQQDDKTCPLPPSNLLLQQSSILSVYDASHDQVYSYQVLYLEPSTVSGSVFVTASSTQFDLEDDSSPLARHGHGIPVRRLPPLLSLHQFYQSCRPPSNNNNQDDTNMICNQPTGPPPHPNVQQLMHALSMPTNARPAEKILHIIGSDSEHHLRTAVETAAYQIGMQCLSIRGLAAFAAHCGTAVTSGSLLDQLAGLEAALDMMTKKTRLLQPCVLHLYDLDEELSQTDDELRHDQENRFWGRLIEALPTCTTRYRRRGFGLDSGLVIQDDIPDDNRYTPPLIVILSTRSPLGQGPWMERLVFDSIRLDVPDRDYTRYLWGNDDLLENDAAMDLLKGRSARDVLWLREKVQNQHLIENEISRSIVTLRQVCQELDTIRRKSSTLVRISNVRWEDVGGLVHVRQEIMDAIELPLKHPHLFPKGGGRSGILLYGPPGTGKTLVAKAVATECGLPFLSVKGPELLGSYVGESEANIRGIFESAREAAARNIPITASILFFDELDSLAPRRGNVGDGGGVMERVVATLFAELDGPSSSSGVDHSTSRVFVMGATNRPDLLDPSLLRPGRLDRLVYLGIPTGTEDRAHVLAALIRKLRLDRDPLGIARDVVSTLPPNLTGADLSTIGSGGLLKAVQRLCRQADEEVRQSNDQVSLPQVLEGWDDDRRVPMVTLDDLIEAAREVVPSVSVKEMERYERLRGQFSSTS